MMTVEGGLYVSPDGCVHTTFTHDPSTFRLSSKHPNMQNIPREGSARKMFVAPLGQTFWAVDYAGIEAILVGYFAQSVRYVRLAKLDIHSFYMAYALCELDKQLLPGDLPREEWSDAELLESLHALKQKYKTKRQSMKPLVHGSNYLMGPFEAQETLLKSHHTVVPLKDIKRLQTLYLELFPEIGRWHQRVTGLDDTGNYGEHEGAYQKGYLRTPFGNIHRYYDVLVHHKGPTGWELRYSTDAKRAVAFLPQSTARTVLTRAAQRLPQDVQNTLRLFIHDELLGMTTTAHVAHCVHEATREMERPVHELHGLVLPTESKTGPCWGDMR